MSARVRLATTVVVGVLTAALPRVHAVAMAGAAGDLRAIPAERWLEPGRTWLRVAELRPWGELPVLVRRIEGATEWRGALRFDAAVESWSAGSVDGSGLGFDVGMRRGSAILWLGTEVAQLRVGDGRRATSVEPWVRLHLGHGETAVVLLCNPAHAVRPADAFGVAARTTLGGARLALEREPDRYGTGAVWHRSLGGEITGALRLALAWSADDLRTVVELRAARWCLRLASVIDGPRTGAHALELGWSR